jgi:hypothetical protein
MGAKLVAVEVVSCCPGSEEGCCGEEEEPPRFTKGETMSYPADEKGLGKKIPQNDS